MPHQAPIVLITLLPVDLAAAALVCVRSLPLPRLQHWLLLASTLLCALAHTPKLLCHNTMAPLLRMWYLRYSLLCSYLFDNSPVVFRVYDGEIATLTGKYVDATAFGDRDGWHFIIYMWQRNVCIMFVFYFTSKSNKIYFIKVHHNWWISFAVDCSHVGTHRSLTPYSSHKQLFWESWCNRFVLLIIFVFIA